MDIAAFVKNARDKKSPCCNFRIQIAYETLTADRRAAVYICLKCDRLHVIDSRDEAAS